MLKLHKIDVPHFNQELDSLFPKIVYNQEAIHQNSLSSADSMELLGLGGFFLPRISSLLQVTWTCAASGSMQGRGKKLQV